MEKDNSFLKGLFSGVITMLIFAGIALFVQGEMKVYQYKVQRKEAKVAESSAESGTLKMDQERINAKIDNIESLINQYYLDEIDQEKVETWMYKGLVAGLGDKYADYYTQDELVKLNEVNSGSYQGIGAVMSQDMTTGLITITRCYEGAPAANAGLLPGDILYSVNNEVVAGGELSEIVNKIKTEPGDTVNIKVAREGENDYLSFDVERSDIEVPTVTYEMLENKIGYIEISAFDTVTENQFQEALSSLENQGMEKLMIDLRNNPGGILSVVCNMLNQILPEGMIVYTEDKEGNREEYKSDGKHEFKKPLAVLVNENSASASEIFAGAIKDYGIGTIVGKTTYGKGIVQRILNLNDGTAIKMTVSKYFTPKGNNIHEVGVKPDVEVELKEELKQKVTIEKSEDNQLQKAIEVLMR